MSSKKYRVGKFTKRDGLKGSKLALLALGFLIAVLVLGKTISLISNLTKPFSGDFLTKKSQNIDFHSSINIAFKTNSIWLLNYDPAEKKAVVLKIPDDTYMDLPRGFGSWRVGSIFGLGQEEKPQIGSELLKESLAKLLGLPVDGFITSQNPSSEDLDKIILSWHNNPFKYITFFSQVKTDLTPLETINLFKLLSSIRSDKLIFLDLEKTDLTKSKLLADSSRVLGINSVNLDLFIREKMADEKISQESISIAIFNATSHPGLALDASRIITNIGGNPIIVTNSETLIEKSAVIGKKGSNTFKHLSQIFAPWCLDTKCQVNDPKLESSRAQINVVLGEDFFKSHYQH